jgi:hypothetical protein
VTREGVILEEDADVDERGISKQSPGQNGIMTGHHAQSGRSRRDEEGMSAGERERISGN